MVEGKRGRGGGEEGGGGRVRGRVRDGKGVGGKCESLEAYTGMKW